MATLDDPAAGSSPRMRGTRFRRQRPCNPLRIIPAYAGNTRCRLSPRVLDWDHPRVCGEHNSISLLSLSLSGSSPRMRGTLVEQVAPCGIRGIIPAYAGNTVREILGCADRRDHPRVCGEHSAISTRVLLPMGSSPRMRGTHGILHCLAWFVGIIPAYAGNTF